MMIGAGSFQHRSCRLCTLSPACYPLTPASKKRHRGLGRCRLSDFVTFQGHRKADGFRLTWLVQRTVDVGKPGVEVGAKTVDHSNDRPRSTRCNGGGAGLRGVDHANQQLQPG
jgi:hypothetical protein